MMKLIGYYFIGIVIIVLIIPLIIVKGCGVVKKDMPDNDKVKNIKVLFHETKKIKETSFEEYIKGVVAAEMPASYGIEALKAQAVAARTYALNKIKAGGADDPVHNGADVCTDPAHCQAWISKEDALKKWPESEGGALWDKISRAVKSTEGELIYYKDELTNPLFHANSGGRTENAEAVWGGEAVPYLQAVESFGEEASSNYTSEAELTGQQLIEKIKKTFPDFKPNTNEIAKSIKITDYTETGRVKAVSIGGRTFSGTEIRSLLDLKSTNFSVEIAKGKIIFKVKGFGHGVGMSQCGANYLAQQGKTYKEILKYYYKGVAVK